MLYPDDDQSFNVNDMYEDMRGLNRKSLYEGPADSILMHIWRKAYSIGQIAQDIRDSVTPIQQDPNKRDPALESLLDQLKVIEHNLKNVYQEVKKIV